jgi:hypothetical protein
MNGYLVQRNFILHRILLHIPHFFWRNREGGCRIVKILNARVHGEPTEDWMEKFFAVRHMVDGFRTYSGYSCFYFMCEYFELELIRFKLLKMG